MRTKKEIIKSMKNKRGVDLRIEIEETKTKFYNKLLELEEEILQSFKKYGSNDDILNISEYEKRLTNILNPILFDNINLKIAYKELEYIKNTFDNAEIILKKKQQARDIVFSLFSEQEQKIFYLLAENKTAQKIAESLNISKRTVESHLKNMLKAIENDSIIRDILKQNQSDIDSIYLTKPSKTIKLLAKLLFS